MNLLKSTHWAALALGLLSAPALAAQISCPITPAYSIITEGGTLQLVAECTGGVLASIDWKMDGTSVTGVVPLTSYAAGNPIKFTTPVGLGAPDEAREFVFSIVGVPTIGNTFTSTSARVVVKPSGSVLDWANVGTGSAANKVPGVCGSAAGSTVAAMPTGTAQCATGSTAALPVSGPQSFTWSCLSTTGGAEASCYAARVASAPAPITGVCGSASNSTPVTAAPGTNLCATGSATSVALGANAYTWGCNGANGGGSTSACRAPRGYLVTTSAGSGGTIGPSKLVAGGTTAAFTVTPSTGYAASVSGCGGSLAGTTYTTGAIAANCTVSATFGGQTAASTAPSGQPAATDPGIGLWVPPNTTNRVVADQSGSSQYLSSYVPGCLNGLNITSASASGCGGTASYKGTVSGAPYTFAFGSGKVLTLRYKSKSTAGASVKYFTLSSGDGGNVGQSVKVWLSTNPAATYDATSTACKSTSTTQPYVLTGPGYCPVTPNQRYYLSMSIDTACTTCRYIVEEGASDFQ